MAIADGGIHSEMTVARGPGSTVLLAQLSRAVYRRATKVVLEIRLKEHTALRHLRDHEGLTQQALGEALHLADRRRDPADRRRHIVVITPTGVRVAQRADRALEAVEDDVLGALSAGERATLRSLLCKALNGQGRAATSAGVATEG
jgi:DNA-binding MarR family transcriptional regulator